VERRLRSLIRSAGLAATLYASHRRLAAVRRDLVHDRDRAGSRDGALLGARVLRY
jgi:hypothetical protein